MSEYQYYEFLAVDRPLTQREMDELRAISSRAEITPTHFSNEYHFGNLKADPGKLLEQYFDVFVYLASWGTRRLAMRFPREALPFDEVAAYCAGDSARARQAGEHVIIDLSSEMEDYEGWVVGAGWMASLAGVRDELLRGDSRALYLAWLLGVECGDVDEEVEEPPVPPGLGNLSASLRAMTDFLCIDEFLVAAAARGSAPEEPESAGFAEWIARLTPGEKDALLLQVARGDHVQVAAGLVRGFREATRTTASDAQASRRTAGDLLARAEESREAHERAQARREAKARRLREEAEAAARAAYLDTLSARQGEAWDEVEQLVESKKPKSYQKAAGLLVDLRDLAARDRDEEAFHERLDDLQDRHARKHSFIKLLDKAGLAGPRSDQP